MLAYLITLKKEPYYVKGDTIVTFNENSLVITLIALAANVNSNPKSVNDIHFNHYVYKSTDIKR